METLKTPTDRKINNKRIKSKSPSKRLGLELTLELPTDRIFYFYKDEDIDQGSVYYPASLFYKLYKRKERLGEGTAGIVRKYVKKSSREKFSVKLTRTRDDEIFSQLKNEFFNMRELKHDNIIQFHEMYYDEFKGLIYLVMEYFEGEDLGSILSEQGIIEGKKTHVLYFLIVI